MEQKPSKKIQPAVTANEAAEAPAVARVYKGSQEVDHDLFKLVVAKMRRNISWSGGTAPEDYVFLDHCHMFHTFDSSGRKQTRSTKTGGHFHEVTIVKTGGVPRVTISGPKTEIKKRVNGRVRPQVIDLSDDDHTHEAEYIRSERIKIRSSNVEAAKVESFIRAQQEVSVPGVLER